MTGRSTTSNRANRRRNTRRAATAAWSRAGLIATLAYGTATSSAAQPSAGEPSGAQVDAPAPAEVESWLDEVDAAFGARDLARYRACFRPAHPSRHAGHIERMRRVFSTRAALVRETRPTRHWQLGKFRISLVEATTRAAGRSDGPSVVEHALVVTRDTESGVRGTLLVEVDAGFLSMIPERDGERPKAAIRCHACNYQIAGGDDWLMVPNCKLRVGALESLSFYSLEEEVAAEVSVHLARATTMPTAEKQLSELMMKAGLTVVGPEQIRPWTPPAYEQPGAPPLPNRLDGATVRLDNVPPGMPSEAWLAVFGRIGYLLTVTGPGEAVANQQPAIERLLGTFQLKESELDPDEVTARIVEERMGGRIEGSAYVNQRYGVRLEGVAGWTPRLDAAHDAFDVLWQCPEQQGLIRAQAFNPPRGAKTWSREAAEAMIRSGLGPGSEGPPGRDWQSATASHGFDWTLQINVERPADSLSVVQLFLADDLLLVVEGRAFHAMGEAKVRDAVRSVRRSR